MCFAESEPIAAVCGEVQWTKGTSSAVEDRDTKNTDKWDGAGNAFG